MFRNMVIGGICCAVLATSSDAADKPVQDLRARAAAMFDRIDATLARLKARQKSLGSIEHRDSMCPSSQVGTISSGVSAVSSVQSTELHKAARNNNVELVTQQLAQGADVNARNKRGFTPLAEALVAKSTETALVLLNCKDLDLEVALGERAVSYLHIAAKLGLEDVVTVLIQKGMLLDAPDTSCATPVHYAATRGGEGALKLLLEAKAPATLWANDRITPLQMAVGDKNLAAVKLLHAANASVNERAIDRTTPLHMASALGSSEIVQYLLEHKADISLTDKCGKTPIMHTISSEQEALHKLLLKAHEQAAYVRGYAAAQKESTEPASEAGGPGSI